MKENRKVEVKLWLPKIDNPKESELKITQADFHYWGHRQAKMRDAEKSAKGVESCAIVELEDGSVRLVQPERVRFLK